MPQQAPARGKTESSVEPGNNQSPHTTLPRNPEQPLPHQAGKTGPIRIRNLPPPSNTIPSDEHHHLYISILVALSLKPNNALRHPHRPIPGPIRTNPTAAGLYRDRTLRRSRWIPHALLLAYLLLPFQAYGAVRGLFSHRGAWHRAPKTGMITESLQEFQNLKPAYRHESFPPLKHG